MFLRALEVDIHSFIQNCGVLAMALMVVSGVVGSQMLWR
jgi:hypothetical protein